MLKGVFQYMPVAINMKFKACLESRQYAKKNETRHSRGEPHTNHIINNTKTNNHCVKKNY